MTNQEAKDTLEMGTPVIWRSPIHGDIGYKRINAIIYRLVEGEIAVSVELLDINGRSVTVVPIKEAFSPVYGKEKTHE